MKVAKKKTESVTVLKDKERLKEGIQEYRQGPQGIKPIEVIERRFQAFELRKKGYSYLQIAEALNVSHATIRLDIQEVYQQFIFPTNETAEELRDLELARLDELVRAYTPMATEVHLRMEIDPSTGLEVPIYHNPDPQYAAILLKIQERRAKLLALDKGQDEGAAKDGVRIYVGVNVDMV